LDQLSAISSGDMAAPLASQEVLVLHVVPFKAFDETQIIGHFPKGLEAMRLAGMEPPASLALSLIGMVGRYPYMSPVMLTAYVRSATIRCCWPRA
jgi:hypothetical protein